MICRGSGKELKHQNENGEREKKGSLKGSASGHLDLGLRLRNPSVSLGGV